MVKSSFFHGQIPVFPGESSSNGAWRHLRRLFGKSALAEAATAQNACCAAAMMVLTFGQRRRGREKMKIEDMMYVIYSGWWFGTFFIFHIVYGIIIPYHPN